MKRPVNVTSSQSNFHLSQINEIDKLAKKYGTDKSTNYNGYAIHYERYFSHLKNEKISLLELGVHSGYSHEMWHEYFQNGNIYGIDINPDSKKIEQDRLFVEIADLDNEEELHQCLLKWKQRYDIIIDDASHTMHQQKSNFINSFAWLKPGGIYVVEDLGTSYWKNWGGGVNKENTMVNFLKDMVDKVNATAYKKSIEAEVYGNIIESAPYTFFEKEIDSICFHKYISFIFKAG